MKRCAWNILLFLLLGAMLNIIVTWTCAIRIPTDPSRTLAMRSEWPCAVPSAWPKRPFAVWEDLTPGAYEVHATSYGPLPRDGRTNQTIYRVWHLELGWPLSSMTSSRAQVLPDANGTLDGRGDPPTNLWAAGLSARALSPLTHPDLRGVSSSRRLPLRPLFPGFAIDTALCSLLLAVLLLTPAALRRRIRRVRGRCVECGYNLRGELDAGCPECGWNRGEARA